MTVCPVDGLHKKNNDDKSNRAYLLVTREKEGRVQVYSGCFPNERDGVFQTPVVCNDTLLLGEHFQLIPRSCNLVELAKYSPPRTH